jgi:hypothetical protein
MYVYFYASFPQHHPEKSRVCSAPYGVMTSHRFPLQGNLKSIRFQVSPKVHSESSRVSKPGEAAGVRSLVWRAQYHEQTSRLRARTATALWRSVGRWRTEEPENIGTPLYSQGRFLPGDWNVTGYLHWVCPSRSQHHLVVLLDHECESDRDLDQRLSCYLEGP